MTLDMWLALGILTVAIVLFVTEWLRVDVVALAVVVALALSGLLSIEQALAGFASPAVITIAALFVVGGAVQQTGLARLMGIRILSIAGSSQARLTAVIMVAVALMSGFMSDTGVVAVMLPAIVSLAAESKVRPSKLLIPLAFGSLLGGASTLIGTPPNIIVTDLLREQGIPTFEFFSFTPMGALLVAAGVVYMLLVGRKLLPSYAPEHEIQQVEAPEELIDLYRLPDNMYRLRVRQQSPLAGNTVAGSRLGSRFNISVLEVMRPSPAQTVARLGDQRLTLQSDAPARIRPVADVELQPDDVLVVQGETPDVQSAAAAFNLAIQPAPDVDHESLVTDEIGIAEVVLPPRSSLIGKTLTDVRFGSAYHLTVLDIRRPGEEGRLNLKDTPLAFGDTLLVLGEWRNIAALRRQRRDFVVIGEPESAAGPPNRQKAPLALLIMLGMLVLMVAGLTSIAAASLLAALMMVLTGCLSMDEAYESVDWKSIVLVAGMLPMATALESAGLVNIVATGVTGALGSFDPRVIMGGLFLLTALFTQVLSNTATTVLIAPIALATSAQLGISPYAFMMAVALGASMAFASPVASPVNTLVMGAGSYRFSDYLRVGAPLIFIGLVITLLALPLLFPFY